MSLYQVSKNNTVLVFTQNQKAPNKVGQELTDRLEELTRKRIPFKEVKAIIETEYEKHKVSGIRGINSVDFSTRSYDGGIQPHHSIYLSYRLNGSFATYTEYESVAEQKGGQE